MPRKIPILAYVIAALTAVSTLLLGAFAAYDRHAQDIRRSAELEQKLGGLADRLALAMVLPIWNFDFDVVDDTIDSLLDDPEVHAVWIALQDNKKSQFIRGRGAGGKPTRLSIPPAAEGGLLARREVRHGDQLLGVVTVYGTAGPKDAQLRREMRAHLLLIFALDLGLIAALYVVLWRSILRPLQNIEDYSAAVAAGHKGALPDVQSPVAEIDSLAVSVGAMVALLEARYEELQRSEARLRETQKMESIGQLAGGVAHDFNNILQVIVTCADLARQGLPPGHAALAEMDAIVESSAKGSKLVRQLLQFSRRQVVEPKVLRLESLVRNMAELISRLLGEGVRLETRFQSGVGPVRVDPGQFEQLLMNLCINARDAVGTQGRILVEVSEAQLKAGEDRGHPNASGPYVILSVSDNGSGIAPEVLPHIFEPFFTTKPQGKGSGLGLATCFGIAAQSGGFISVDSLPGLGTSFKVWLPRAEAAESDVAPLTALGRPPLSLAGQETLLLTEDDAVIRRALERLLKAKGYRVLTAANAIEGLQLAAVEPVSLVISDLVMPEISGQDYARRLRERRPGQRFLFMSGYAESLAGQELTLEPGDAFLSKPFATAELFTKIRQILDSSERG
jgi:signal transduction histidine kinase/CheY-like chemotaxis protein